MACLVYNINLPEVEVRPSAILGVKTNAGRELYGISEFATLETKRELEPKFVLRCFCIVTGYAQVSYWPIGQLHDDVILLQLPESFSLLFSCAN